METWSDWLAPHGVPEERWNDASAVVDPDGTGPRIDFQRVPEEKTLKNRLHLDLKVGGRRATTLLLTLRLDRPSTVFRTFRLIGLVAITITGVVYHVALAGLFDLSGLHKLGDQLVNTVVPLMAVTGWLIFGPRTQTSPRVAWLSALYPLC